MSDSHAKFLPALADELRQLAGRAPDISADLRRFADDLDRLAGEPLADDASPEAA